MRLKSGIEQDLKYGRQWFESWHLMAQGKDPMIKAISFENQLKPHGTNVDIKLTV